MIYILTGIAKSGKTLLANEIKKRYSISTFSTDYIMMMLAKGNPELSIDIDASDSTVARDLEPYIYHMMKTMVENGDTFLIEGVHFNTSFSKRLQNEFKDKIKIVYLGYKEVTVEKKCDELRKNKDKMNNPWIFNHNKESLEDIVAYMISESNRVFNECITQNLDYIEILDINTQKNSIISHLISANQ